MASALSSASAVLAACIGFAAPVAAAGRHASMVIDANTGQVLHAQASDDVRYPASLTKMMTLYIAFELIEQGRMGPSSRIRISDEAAGAPPSKLGLQPGTDIAASDAIKAIVTKSANDISVALAEHIAGSEAKFAILMTRKAREIGMSQTTFKNAHGLPDSGQVTTARDMLTLALRLNDDFPKFYSVFGLRAFSYNGRTYRNHNTMLGSYQGMDGLKTGYTTASGFNLVASVRRNGRHVVAAVFGGSSASARNAHMRTILDRALAKASTEKTRVHVAAAAERREGAKRKGASQATAAMATTPATASQPALVEPVRAVARPLDSRPLDSTSPMGSPAPPRMPQRVAEALRTGDANEAQTVIDRPVRDIDATSEPDARVTASAHTPTAAAPIADPTPVQIYKVRPVMVAPRARQAPSAMADASPEASAVPAAPPSDGRQMQPRPSFAGEPANVVLDRAQPPSRQRTLAAPASATAGERPISAIAAATPAIVEPLPAPSFAPKQRVRASAPPPPPVAVSAAPSPQPVAVAPGRGMAPSSLQAQAERLDRGIEPQRAIASAHVGPRSARPSGLRGPDPTSVTQTQSPTGNSSVAIQVGAYPTEVEAQRRLEAVRARAGGILKSARSVAEPVQSGSRTLYRARFVGLESGAATTACSELRRQQIDCLVAR